MTDRVILRAVLDDATSHMAAGELGYILGTGELIFGYFGGVPGDAQVGGAVKSVAGRTGAVVLAYGDIAGLAPVSHSGRYADLTGSPAPFQTFTYTQSTPSATWTINHNLGRIPNIVVLDSTNRLIEGDETYNSTNQVTIAFSSAFAGVATLT